MISDVTLSALANWLGSLTMILIVVYHVSRAAFTAHEPHADLATQALSVNVKRNQDTARRLATTST